MLQRQNVVDMGAEGIPLSMSFPRSEISYLLLCDLSHGPIWITLGICD